MSAITSKGGIRNKKIIAVLEKYVYPDTRSALSNVNSINIHIYSLLN